jgi:asparagine synthase (glutamine-hydrolysing)
LNLSLLIHRGPDGLGEWSAGPVWFGHTRLAILDLTSSAAQPMCDPASGNVIIFNGEIYNHLALRKELQGQGFKFTGTSDTETILLAYSAWGEAVLGRLKGMFAFAIYDAKSGSVWLCRDRFGIKPLYIHCGPEGFFFSSEVRWLVDAASSIHPPDKKTLAAYLQAGSCPASRLLFPQISELPPATSLWVRNGIADEPKRYWVPMAGRFGKSPSDGTCVQKTRELIEVSVSEHLLSDVPVACLLSGGIDSTIITALAAKHSPRKVTSFSVGFSEGAFDESAAAEKTARQLGCDHHAIRLDEEEVIQTVQRAVLAMDLPSTDAINTFIVSEQVAKAGFKVALSGLGADELFGGYSFFRELPVLKYLSLIPKSVLSLLMATGKGLHYLDDLPGTPDIALYDLWWRRCAGSKILQSLGLPCVSYPETEMPPHLDSLGQTTWAELRNYLVNTLLRDSDTMSMAVSLELRVPFLDNDLFEYVLTLPKRCKQYSPIPKALLIDSCRDLLPNHVMEKTKMGFVLPMRQWMEGPLNAYSKSGLASLSEIAGLKPEAIKSLWNNFLSNPRARWSPVWALVVLGHYLAKSCK